MQSERGLLHGVVRFFPKPHGDARGFLVESFRQSWADEAKLPPFVQENHSRSQGGVLRGIHVTPADGAGKLIRCARGAIFDVAVDLRDPDSATFGRWEGYVLSDDNHEQLYVPPGFGHGFFVMSDVADVIYKLAGYYRPDAELEVRWDDPDIGIRWPEACREPQLSPRDVDAPSLAGLRERLERM